MFSFLLVNMHVAPLFVALRGKVPHAWAQNRGETTEQETLEGPSKFARTPKGNLRCKTLTRSSRVHSSCVGLSRYPRGLYVAATPFASVARICLATPFGDGNCLFLSRIYGYLSTRC